VERRSRAVRRPYDVRGRPSVPFRLPTGPDPGRVNRTGNDGPDPGVPVRFPGSGTYRNRNGYPYLPTTETYGRPEKELGVRKNVATAGSEAGRPYGPDGTLRNEYTSGASTNGVR